MRIGFIGGGNMAEAIIGGITAAGLYKSSEVYVTDVNPDDLEKYKNKGINCSNDLDTALSGEIVIFAVKPFVLPGVLKELSVKKEKIKDKVFVSIAAGVSVSKIKEGLGFDAKVIRVMPNTPALACEAMSVLVSDYLPADEKEFISVKNIFDAIGKTSVMPESLISAVTSVSGSGPAYVYMMIEAMADAGVSGGLARKDAYLLAAQTVLGAAKMVLDTGLHPAELKDMVCSPKGTTIEAVAELEKTGFRGALISAIEKCREKAENM